MPMTTTITRRPTKPSRQCRSRRPAAARAYRKLAPRPPVRFRTRFAEIPRASAGLRATAAGVTSLAGTAATGSRRHQRQRQLAKQPARRRPRLPSAGRHSESPRELARGSRGALDDGAIWSNGMSNMSCRTNASRSAGPGCQGLRAARGQPSPPGALGTRGRSPPRGPRLVGPVPHAGPGASATCSSTPARR